MSNSRINYYLNKIFLLKWRIINKFRKLNKSNSILLSSKKILESNFRKNASFSFIQVGANDGKSFDFLFDFVIHRDSVGVVIEPVVSYFTELQNNYKNFPKIKAINKAIHADSKEVDIYKINSKHQHLYPDWVKGIASLDPDHHIKTNINSNHVVVEKVEADNLGNVISANYNSCELDYFQVDTEGFDYEVLKMLDFKLITPSIIKYESVNLSVEDKIKSKTILENQGYYIFDEYGDTIGLKLEKIKLF